MIYYYIINNENINWNEKNLNYDFFMHLKKKNNQIL